MTCDVCSKKRITSSVLILSSDRESAQSDQGRKFHFNSSSGCRLLIFFQSVFFFKSLLLLLFTVKNSTFQICPEPLWTRPESPYNHDPSGLESPHFHHHLQNEEQPIKPENLVKERMDACYNISHVVEIIQSSSVTLLQ